MRHKRMIHCMFALLIAASSAQAQTGDWQAVKNLKPGSQVIVKAQRGYSCSVEGANDDQLVCEVQEHRSLRTSTLTIPRAEVREVRSEEHTSELQSRGHLVCRLLLEKKKKTTKKP